MFLGHLPYMGASSMSNEEIVKKIKDNIDVNDNLAILWGNNKRFIYQIASKYAGMAEHDDLMQEGYMGLCNAVYKYDIDLNEFYAFSQIKEEVKNPINVLSNSFKELINKTSYYKDITINLLELSKLSKKNEIAFYEIDERFSKLESDYIIVVKDKKILTLIDFESADLNTLLSIFE